MWVAVMVLSSTTTRGSVFTYVTLATVSCPFTSLIVTVAVVLSVVS